MRICPTGEQSHLAKTRLAARLVIPLIHIHTRSSKSDRPSSGKLVVEFIITLFALVPFFNGQKKDANGDFTGQVASVTLRYRLWI